MKNVWTIASKELRSFFGSAVALIFLATFLGAVLFFFFWKEKFFARNIADIRPMFEWLPLLLIFLVAALTMRLWSEEQKLGTLEILLTLPVKVHHLVIGKFLAGLILVTLALFLTIGLPITVSQMGNLDWGPILGGYAGAVLLAGAYLSIGLCVSSLTDNQVPALIFTVLACAVLYVPGTDAVAGLFDYESAEMMRQLGTGSRFDSIARGVIDLRDVVYYLGIIALFLVVNTALLHAKSWSTGRRTFKQRLNVKLLVGLCLVNVLVANLWLAPVTAARIDLTENNEYSLSPVTEKLLRSVDEPLLLRAYISKKTHPLVAPLVPQIRDLLEEYGIAGGSNVRVEFVDPLGNESAEKEAKESFGIDALTFKFQERNQSAWVNAYFSLLIKYGDQFEVLNIMDLLEVDQRGIEDIEVRVGNLEYDVTRSIKKVVEGFQNKDRLFATIPAKKIVLTAYITPKTLPENLAEVPKRVQQVAKELEKQSNGKFKLKVEEPATEAEIRELFQKYQLRPHRAFLLAQDYFYLHFILDVGGQLTRILPRDEMTESDLREAIMAGLRRSAPGYLKKAALWAPQGFTMPGNPQFGQRPQRIPPAQGFGRLKRRLENSYELVEADLGSGQIGADIDILILAGPERLSKLQLYAVDQFLMRGGTVVVLTGPRLKRARGIAIEKVDSGLAPLLASYGVELGNELVLDPAAERLAVPMPQDDGRVRVTEVPYPFFLDVRRKRINRKSLIATGVPAVIPQFAIAVRPSETTKGSKGGKKTAAKADKDKGGKDEQDTPDIEYTWLLRTSDKAWSKPDLNVMLDATGGGFERPDDLAAKSKGPFDIGVVVTGSFVSHFAKTGKPADSAGEKKDEDKKRADRTVKRSPAGTRLVVISSSTAFSDEGQQFAEQLAATQRYKNNLLLVENIVGWALADDDLVGIRARGSVNRTLEIDKDAHGKWEWINYSLVLVGLLLVAGASFVRRRMMVPMALVPRSQIGELGARSEGERASEREDESEGEDEGEGASASEGEDEGASEGEDEGEGASASEGEDEGESEGESEDESEGEDEGEGESEVSEDEGDAGEPDENAAKKAEEKA